MFQAFLCLFALCTKLNASLLVSISFKYSPIHYFKSFVVLLSLEFSFAYGMRKDLILSLFQMGSPIFYWLLHFFFLTSLQCHLLPILFKHAYVRVCSGLLTLFHWSILETDTTLSITIIL